jgi:hypothetical protein
MKRLVQQWRLGAVKWEWRPGSWLVDLYVWRRVWRGPYWGRSHRVEGAGSRVALPMVGTTGMLGE